MCIERIVDLNQMHLSVESKIEAADAHKRRGYLSESNFINLYTFAGVLNGMWSCVDEWKKDKETGSIEKFLSDKKRILENVNELGKYSFCEKGENAYILSIGNHRFITLQFSLEKARGTLYGNVGAANMREYMENQAADQEEHTHLFATIGNSKIDLEENLYPSELRIKNTHVNGGQNPDSTLEFELDIVFTRDGIREWNRIMFFSVDLYGEDRFRFEYANGSYDSVDGKIEKFTF